MNATSSVNLAAATLAAYAHWAPSYPPLPHNPLMRAEQRAMLALWPDVRGRRVLDLACGSGRYARLVAQHGGVDTIAVDCCQPMLARVAAAGRVCASMMQLPFATASFDVVIAGLAIGHATDLGAWMREAARVLRPGGTLLYSDFHPAAARAGLTRAFKDENQRTWQVPFHCFDLDAQAAAAAAAGLSVEGMQEVRVGVELSERFAACEEFYARWDGLPMVLVVRARR